jgi:hypothetical protein
MGTGPGARLNTGIRLLQLSNRFRKIVRHSREGGNPSPEFHGLKQARLILIA